MNNDNDFGPSSSSNKGSGSKRLQKSKPNEVIDIAGDESETEFIESSSQQQKRPKTEEQHHQTKTKELPPLMGELKPSTIKAFRESEKDGDSPHVNRMGNDEDYFHEASVNEAELEAYNLRNQSAQKENDNISDIELEVVSSGKKRQSTAGKENRRQSPVDRHSSPTDDSHHFKPTTAFPDKASRYTRLPDAEENGKNSLSNDDESVDTTTKLIFKKKLGKERPKQEESPPPFHWQEGNKKRSQSSSSSKTDNKRPKDDESEDDQSSNQNQSAVKMRARNNISANSSASKNAATIDLT